MRKIIFLSPLVLIGIMMLQPFSIDEATMARGKKIYKQYCITCHQLDGGGVPNMNPPLEKTAYVNGSKTRLIRIILKGMNTHEEIEGETYSNVMAPYNFMTDQQISDVLTFVRNSFGNKSTPVTPGDVKYVRARTL